MTLIAFTKNSPATRAVWASLPYENIPTPGTSTTSGSAPRMAGDSGVCVPVVVRLVVLAVGRVQLVQPCDLVIDGGRRGQVEQQRLHLGAQEVVRAARPELGECRRLLARQEVEHDVAVRDVPDHRLVVSGDAADRRGERGRTGTSFVGRQCVEARADGAERLVLAVLGDVPLGGVDDPARVRLGLVARVAPRGDAVAAQDRADRVRVLPPDGRDVEAELEARSAPGDPHDLVTEDRRRELGAVRGRGDRDAGVRVQVVHVRGVDQGVHRRVDRRRGAALAVQAEVERGDHVVLVLDAGVDLLEGPDPVDPQHRQPRRGQRAEVAPGALHPQQFDGLAGHRVDVGALRRGVPAGVVRDPRVRAERVRARDERTDRLVC